MARKKHLVALTPPEDPKNHRFHVTSPEVLMANVDFAAKHGLLGGQARNRSEATVLALSQLLERHGLPTTERLKVQVELLTAGRRRGS